MSEADPKHENRLAGETSPYLLQHAHNPVDWYPWGPAALERARTEDRPILLSIGYAACHWCHVMERESFENDDIARLMNENFVCIKVDREERPDLDDIYMTATVALSGSGGWPMTVFLAPDRRPFFAGTYFPPEDKYGRPGFSTLLERIAELWKNDRDALLQQASELTQHVRDVSKAAPPLPVADDATTAAVRQLAQAFDPAFGGFSAAPKFPPCSSLSLLLRQHRRTGDPRALSMVTTTLDGMKNGGMYDHVGGGFARYSTDERWLVPHFEKMLYDNAQLASVYLEAFQVTGNAEYRRVATETLDYVLREMQAPEGGFYCATDADSEGEEGKFFVWQPDEVEAALGAGDARLVCAFYDITKGGNWEGKSIAHTPRTLADVAKELGIGEEALADALARSREKLYAAREKRVHPLLDDKILTSWNGLMIASMAEGARVLGERRYLDAGVRAARYILDSMRRADGGLFRTARGGRAHLDAYLEDYAFLADALVSLYEAGAAASFLQEAKALAERLLADFGDDEGGAFFHTAHGHEELIVRTREGNDGAIPSANAVAARALARLSYHFDREDFRSRASDTIQAYGRLIERAPRAFATSLAVVDFLLEGPLELVLAGTPGHDDHDALAAAVGRHYLPNRIVGHVASAEDAKGLPLCEGKGPVGGTAALFVCRNFTCKAPVTDPAAVGEALAEGSRRADAERGSEIGRERLTGHATTEGTGAYAARHAATAFVKLGALSVSRLGFGGYRVDDGAPEHRAALVKAFGAGVNLVDTSTNYTDGRSERLVGEVLAELAQKEELSRSEVVVVSKIGYVQGENLDIARQRRTDEKPYPEMVEVGDDIWHCMHPEWLGDQLDRSLGRLGLETLDVCLVHNPEYFLSNAVRRGEGPLSKLRDEFYRRLEQAFAHFEKEVERGRIRFFGVSSNTCTRPADDREATSLSRMLAAARAAGGEQHHFRVLQLPMNLAESGALFEQNNDDKTVLELARDAGIAVLVNRPLNAIVGDGLLRLADAPGVDGAPPFGAQLSRVQSLEQEFRRNIAPHLQTAKGSAPASSLFNWGDQLAKLPARIESLEQWRDIQRQVIAPRVGHALSMLDQALEGELAEQFRDFRVRYLPELDKLLGAMRAKAAGKSRARTARIVKAIDPLLPAERRGATLSQKALWTLTSVPGVTTVLVGARQPEYVDDALGISGWEALGNVTAVFEAVQGIVG